MTFDSNIVFFLLFTLTLFRWCSQDDFKISFVAGKGFSVSNNDPEVLAILHEFEKLGSFSATDIEANQEFIQEFIRKHKNRTKTERPPVAHKNQNGPPSLLDRQIPTKRHSTPPPLPAALIHKQVQTKRNSTPLPPSLPNQSTRQSPSGSLSNSPYPPTPPLTAPSTPMLTYTKPPTLSISRPPTPVTIPSPPLLSSSPIETSTTKKPSLPPPPPPPPVFQANDRPLPTSTVNNKATSSSSSKLTTNSKDSHHDLLAAIRSTGGFGSLKRSGTLKSVAVNEKNGLKSNSQVESHGMTASLAAVLQKRKTVMQSDDENDSDDDWD